MGVTLRASKYVGFLAISLGALLIVAAAVLPVSAMPERFGPFRVDLSHDNCGPAGYVAFHQPNTDCGSAATRRLLATTPVGMLVLAAGMALFAGGDERRGSRVEVTNPRARYQSRSRRREDRRSVPG